MQSFTLQGPQCPAPGQAQAVVSGQEVAFSWQGVEQATAYELSYGPTPQGPEQAVLVAEPRYLLLQQPAGQAFAFRVRSHCANGQVSPWSLPQAYQTPELPQEPAWESDPELSYTPPPDNPQATEEPAWQATDPTQADEPQPPADPVADALADALAEPIAVVLPLDTSGAAGQGGEVAVLPPNPSLEQLRAAAKKVPPTCAGITATYVCGSHDAPPSYSGESISIAAGDELAMNSLVLTVVSIDGAGNGVATIKVPMLNGARLALKLSGIQAVKGGCIVAGRAEIDPSVPLLQLDDKLRQNLQTLSLANQLVANAGQQYAQQIADGVNATLQAIEQLGQKITEKKRNTQALLANSSTENLALVLDNCTDMAAQTKVLQDTLHSIICKIEAGKLKANAAKLKEAYRANIAFMNKLGPALNECNPANNFQPWSELPCKGPCDNTIDYYTLDEKCYQALRKAIGNPNPDSFTSVETIENQTTFKADGPGPFLIWTPTNLHLQEIGEEIKVLKILHKNWSDSRLYLTAAWNVYKGIIHTALDVVGFVPLIGELADGTNAIFYLAEGDKGNASLSAISLIPMVGDAAGKGTKYTRKVVNWVKVGNRYFSSPARKAAYEVLYNKYASSAIADAIWDARNSKLIRKAIEDAGKGLKQAWQAHHIIPKELIEEFPLIQKAIDQGFDFNKLVNLIPLSTTRHSGSHPVFTGRVRAKLNFLIQNNKNKSAKEIVEMAIRDIENAINTQKTKHIEDVIF